MKNIILVALAFLAVGFAGGWAGANYDNAQDHVSDVKVPLVDVASIEGYGQLSEQEQMVVKAWAELEAKPNLSGNEREIKQLINNEYTGRCANASTFDQDAFCKVFFFTIGQSIFFEAQAEKERMLSKVENWLTAN